MMEMSYNSNYVSNQTTTELEKKTRHWTVRV